MFAGAKRAVNQGILAFGAWNGCVFSGVLRWCEEIDLPRGIGVYGRRMYILAKGYFLAKVVLYHRA